MLIDALTKDMDLSHLHRVLEAGEWCAKFTTRFVKANKPVKAKAPTDEVMVGKNTTSRRSPTEQTDVAE